MHNRPNITSTQKPRSGRGVGWRRGLVERQRQPKGGHDVGTFVSIFEIPSNQYGGVPSSAPSAYRLSLPQQLYYISNQGCPVDKTSTVPYPTNNQINLNNEDQ